MAESKENQIEAIVSSLEQHGLPAAPVVETLDLVRSDSTAVFKLTTDVMERFPKGGTFLDAALSYLPDQEWNGLVFKALDHLEATRENEAAESVISYCSLQSPRSLHSELDRVFRLQPNSGSYNEFYPWRESGELHFGFLKTVLGNESNSIEDRQRAWEAMLQTRDPSAIAFAVSQFDSVHGPDFRGWKRADLLDAYLGPVGLQLDDGDLNTLCPSGLYHLTFGGGFFEDDPPPWLQRMHPTWLAAGPATEAAFGGSSDGTCSACSEPLHHLLTLDLLPDDIGVSELPRLELATCLSCLGWELDEMFFEHDEHGKPRPIGYSGDLRSPEFPVGPLKKASVEIAATAQRWQWQDWGLSNSRENLHRIGGEPSWVQDAQYPDCPACKRRMCFLLQLDSELPTADGDSWLWGSGGIAYGFWCDDCNVSGFLWQCT